MDVEGPRNIVTDLPERSTFANQRAHHSCVCILLHLASTCGPIPVTIWGVWGQWPSGRAAYALTGPAAVG